MGPTTTALKVSLKKLICSLQSSRSHFFNFGLTPFFDCMQISLELNFYVLYPSSKWKEIVVMCSCPPYCLVPADILSDSCSRCQGNVLVIAHAMLLIKMRYCFFAYLPTKTISFLKFSLLFVIAIDFISFLQLCLCYLNSGVPYTRLWKASS